MQSIIKNIEGSARYLESNLWDKWMNVETRHSDGLNKMTQGKKGDSLPFQTSAHYTIRKAIKLIQSKCDDTVIELGCGKGRAVCHFARLRLKKVIGIEISTELSEIAKKNARQLRGRRAPIEIRNMDVLSADFSEGSIFYMFNPFGEKTLRAVLSKIELSHKEIRKQATIVYINPLFSNIFNDFPWLEKTQDVRIYGSLRTMIYTTKY